jgi:hypothetical protein
MKEWQPDILTGNAIRVRGNFGPDRVLIGVLQASPI